MTMDATGHPRGGCSSGAPLLLVGGGGGGGGSSPPATPSYSPSLPTTAATPAQAPAHPPAHPPPVSATQVPAPQPRQTVKRSFDVAFLMAPDENLAKRQQLRLVAANALLKRPSPPPPQPPAPHHQGPLDPEGEVAAAGPRARAAAAAAAAAAAVKAHAAAGIFEPSGFFLPRAAYASCDGDVTLLGTRPHHCYDDLLDARAKQPHKVLGELHDSLQSNAIIRSAFTKVTASGGGAQSKAFDAGALLGPPLATSPSSSLSGGGLSPDHVAYQGSMSPPGGSDGHTSSPVPAHFLPAHAGAGGGGKTFPGGGGVPLLSPQAAHAAHAGPSPSKASLASAYSSAAFLHLQQEHGAKHIKPPAAHVLCGPGGTPPAANGMTAGGGSFRADVDSYLIKSQAQQLYEKEMAFASGGSAAGGGGPKVRPAGMLYPHADSVAAYSTLAAAAAYPFAANFSPESLLSVARAPPPAGLLAATNPAAAAAMVSASLLPPSFAALSLPAQNVCAKCNISFRMTSDLVYHMRSQHKSDSQHTADPLRRRREQDKLKCPVCNESFRERHHLTRHMTAHQDKDGDADEQDEAGGDAAAARRRAAVAAAAAAGSAGAAAAAAAAHVAK